MPNLLNCLSIENVFHNFNHLKVSFGLFNTYNSQAPLDYKVIPMKGFAERDACKILMRIYIDV